MKLEASPFVKNLTSSLLNFGFPFQDQTMLFLANLSVPQKMVFYPCHLVKAKKGVFTVDAGILNDYFVGYHGFLTETYIFTSINKS